MVWRFGFTDFGCGGLSKPFPVIMAVNVPVWSLRTQPETKASWELLKSKCPLMFEAFSADDEVSIGNGHGDTEE